MAPDVRVCDDHVELIGAITGDHRGALEVTSDIILQKCMASVIGESGSPVHQIDVERINAGSVTLREGQREVNLYFQLTDLKDRLAKLETDLKDRVAKLETDLKDRPAKPETGQIETIRRVAHYLWEAGGRRHGRAVEDWAEAERAVRWAEAERAVLWADAIRAVRGVERDKYCESYDGTATWASEEPADPVGDWSSYPVGVDGDGMDRQTDWARPTRCDRRSGRDRRTGLL